MDSMWKYHNQALNHPEYQLEGVMDCFREEMSYYMPYPKDVQENTISVQVEPQWNRRQWGEVQQLKAQVLFLYSKVNEMRANASKRKTYIIK